MIGQLGRNSSVDAPKQPAGELIVDSLRAILDKASIVDNRLQTLNDRVFGSVPCNSVKGEKLHASNGLVATVTNQLQELHDTLERITATVYDLERLA